MYINNQPGQMLSLSGTAVNANGLPTVICVELIVVLLKLVEAANIL